MILLEVKKLCNATRPSTCSNVQQTIISLNQEADYLARRGFLMEDQKDKHCLFRKIKSSYNDLANQITNEIQGAQDLKNLYKRLLNNNKNKIRLGHTWRFNYIWSSAVKLQGQIVTGWGTSGPQQWVDRPFLVPRVCGEKLNQKEAVIFLQFQ